MTTQDADRRIVKVMPLHAITAMYGERGLRKRFSIESIRLGDAAGQRKAVRALELASRLHARDRRQREPYINHSLRVALRILCHYGVNDTDVICAALLHDSVEDHADDLSPNGRPGAFASLTADFGPQVAELVEAVTNPVYAPGIDEDEQYREHVVQSLAQNPWARVIKFSDFTDNGVGVIHTTGQKAVRLASKLHRSSPCWLISWHSRIRHYRRKLRRASSASSAQPRSASRS
jgi:(p)ppGpp synthase/HD superfamily hydrolase